MFCCFKTGTLTEDSLEVYGVVGVHHNQHKARDEQLLLTHEEQLMNEQLLTHEEQPMNEQQLTHKVQRTDAGHQQSGWHPESFPPLPLSGHTTAGSRAPASAGPHCPTPHTSVLCPDLRSAALHSLAHNATPHSANLNSHVHSAVPNSVDPHSHARSAAPHSNAHSARPPVLFEEASAADAMASVDSVSVLRDLTASTARGIVNIHFSDAPSIDQLTNCDEEPITNSETTNGSSGNNNTITPVHNNTVNNNNTISVSGDDVELLPRVAPVCELPQDSRVLVALATCHDLTYVHGKLVGDPLDIQMFQATGWVSVLLVRGILLGGVTCSRRIMVEYCIVMKNY